MDGSCVKSQSLCCVEIRFRPRLHGIGTALILDKPVRVRERFHCSRITLLDRSRKNVLVYQEQCKQEARYSVNGGLVRHRIDGTGLEYLPSFKIRVCLIGNCKLTNSENGKLRRDRNKFPNQTQNSSKRQVSNSSRRRRGFQLKNTITSLVLGNNE